MSARQLNPNTSYKIIKDELEPTEFKQYFTEWEGEIDGQTYQAGRGIATKGACTAWLASRFLDHFSL